MAVQYSNSLKQVRDFSTQTSYESFARGSTTGGEESWLCTGVLGALDGRVGARQEALKQEDSGFLKSRAESVDDVLTLTIE